MLSEQISHQPGSSPHARLVAAVQARDLLSSLITGPERGGGEDAG
jgi:hypothetical protein